MSEIIDEKLKRERFGQLFEMIGDGLLEYIALSEYCLGIDPKAKENNNNKEDNKNTENNPKQTLQISIPNEFNSKSEQHLLLQNLKLYKLQYQRMVKLRKNYAGLRLKLERGGGFNYFN
uniref:RNase III domain-containing protein n=1 Tax=Meloidogyne hapla TaxID=6305 RepID=A0A1I8B3N4_MELHA